ncbi:MAG: hypothetical protein EZS28_001447 [Streblomastix strix]|uniref:Uncharacterized protein n=1 Tax=Streblomastix strix TaxID=222440 RepID=A0A5J4X700_9EUKA|nr:MAG: hypothetical protein EZS28_001447 [Streblomastix strix]
MTMLGTATGGGNAIIDLSFDGNTLVPAKNSSFIMTNYDETITGQKTFNTTIHSVGIMVQSYDNVIVVCACGVVKSIQNINASVGFSNYYNKSQTYSQTETDQKFNLKLNINDQIDAYTKGEDDALLLLKADKTQLIDAYTKIETNNPLNNKAESGVSYTKGEADALLLLKADKTQLIDAYNKTDVDALLDDKLNICDQIDAQTKGENDALLLLKANQSTTYTKTETDYLISQIEVGDVDLSDYMTLSTSQTITANQTFNNACRFKNSIDGMATNKGASFVKSGTDDSVALLGAGGTKPISEFDGSVDDSNYVKKDDDVQDIQGILRKTTLDQLYPEPTDDDYITL